MKSKEFQIIFVLGLLNFCSYGVYSDEQNDVFKPIDDYIQIFKNIPALFEYLLDALEQRPEILEKNDVFKRDIETTDTNECRSSDCKKKPEKRAVIDNQKAQEKHGNDESIDKTEAGKVKLYTTVANDVLESKAVKPDNGDTFASNNDIQTLADEKIRNRRDYKSIKNRNEEYKLNDERNDQVFRDHGDTFFGFEHLFGLDLKPEDIEEHILTAEKLLEDHNNKQDKKE